MQDELITKYIPEGTFFTLEEGLELSKLSKDKLSFLLEKAMSTGLVGMADEKTYYTATYDDYFKEYLSPSYTVSIKYVLSRYNAYISDSLAYNAMRLTTQVPAIYTIAGNSPIKDKKFSFRFNDEPYVLRQSRLIPQNTFDWKVLRFLDALEYFDNVQDVSDWVLYLRMRAEYNQFTDEEKQTLFKYMRTYPELVTERFEIVAKKVV